MRQTIVAMAAAFGLTACGGTDEYPDDYRPTDAGTDVVVDPAIYDHPVTSELGTEKTRPIAKTIEWPGISSQVGESYHGGRLVIGDIRREDAGGNYGVRIRLKNASEHLLNMEYLVRFYTRRGGQLAGWLGHNGQDAERWKGFVVEPYGTANVGDFCRVMGAEGFRLYVRGAGSELEGTPDAPEPAEGETGR